MSEPGTTVESPEVQPEVLGGPAAPEHPPEPTPEQLAVEVERPGGRQQMVPVGALKEERQARQALQGKYGQLEATVQQLQQELALHRQYLERQQAPAPTPQPAQPDPVDQEALEFARLMDLYMPNGQPDLMRARRALEMSERRAEAKVRAEVEPLRQTAASGQAAALRQQAYDAKDRYGRPVASRQAIDQVFGIIPPHLLTEDTARFLLFVASGVEGTMRAPQAQAAPAFTETSGGRVGAAPGGYSGAERYAMNRLGVSESEFSKMIPATVDPAGGLVLE